MEIANNLKDSIISFKIDIEGKISNCKLTTNELNPFLEAMMGFNQQ